MQVAGLFRWAPVSPQHSSCITCSIGSASRLSPSYTLHSDPLRRLEIAPSAACAPCADSTRGNFRTEQRWLCPAAANGGLPWLFVRGTADTLPWAVTHLESSMPLSFSDDELLR